MINIRVFALVILFTVVPTQAFPGEWTDWEWIEPSPQGQQLYAVASNHDTVVAVGWSGAIVVSDDGVRWRAQVPIQWKALYDVVWAGDQFIAVGDGVILTSSDGSAWTEALIQVNDEIRTVIWTGTETIAFGLYGTTYLSVDGESWVEYRPSNSQELYLTDVAWNGEFFVAVGSESFHLPFAFIFISEDGREWQPLDGVDVPYFFYRSIAWGNGVFVVVGTPENHPFHVIMVSDDGRDWTSVPFDPGAWGLTEISFGNGGFSSTGGNGLFALSNGGVYWTVYNSGDRNQGFGTGWFKETLIVVGQYGLITTSRDAITWNQINQRTFDLGNESINDIARGSDIFVAVAPGILGLSDDGGEWSTAEEPLMYWSTVRWAEGAFWATRYWDGSPGGPEVARSTNGEQWEVVLSGSDFAVWGQFADVAVSPRAVVVVGSSYDDPQAPVILSKRDDGDWVLQEFPERGHDFTTVVWTGERFLVASYLKDGVLLGSFDGVAWFPQEIGLPVQIRSFESNGDRTVGVGATNTAAIIVSSADGITWKVSDLGRETPFASDITWTGDRFVAGGLYLLTSRDGINWDVDVNPFGFFGNCVAGDESTILTAGREGTIFRASRVERPPRRGDDRAAPDGPG